MAYAQDDVPLYRADARLVLLHASVIDKNGRLVTNVPQSAFKIFEDGVEQPLRLFRREDVPVSMGILVDNSGSMGSKRSRVAAAALELVKQSNPDDEVFIVNFNDDTHIDQGLTNDVKKLEAALAMMQVRGGTAMRDALSKSIAYVKRNGKKDKKVLVVITDGNDNSSLLSLERIMKSAHQSGVLIYGVGLLAEEEHREASRARRALNDLAEATGGKTFFPQGVEEVDAIAHLVAHDIRSQYIIEYSPANAAMDNTFRAIRITAKAPGNPTVRTRSGYYATPDAKTAAK